MVIGGYNYQLSHNPAVWLYNFVEQSWSALSSMSDGRYGHICAFIHSDARGDEVVVAGGANGARERTEVFSLRELEWRAGADTPRDVDFGQAIDYNGSFLALGGIGFYSNVTLSYDVDAETWGVVPRGPNKANYDFAAIIVDMPPKEKMQQLPWPPSQ